MSYWTHIAGFLVVSPLGRTQHEKTYVLNTVLDHLPLVTGSEGDMHIAVNIGTENWSSTHDEFCMRTNNLKDRYGDHSRKYGFMRGSERYYLTISGDFRDRMFNQTFHEFQKWLCRLAKRISVDYVSVTILSDNRKPYHIEKHGWNNPYAQMFEEPSWVKGSEGEPTWCEYLLWEPDPYTGMPLSHVYKYVASDSVDKEMERRRKWRDKRDED